MMKNYTSKFFMIALLLYCQSAFAQNHTVTFNVDMNGVDVSQGVWITGTFGDLNDDVNFNPVSTNLQLTDGDADGIYTTTLTVSDGTNRFNFYNAKNWANNGQVPDACQAPGETYRQYEATFTEDATVYYTFGGCELSVWNGSSWDYQAPQNNGHLVINGDYTATEDIVASYVTVQDGSTVTVPSGKSLTINGTAKVGQSPTVYEPVINNDFEGGTVPGAVTGAATVTVEQDANEVTSKSLQIINKHSTNGGTIEYAYYAFTITTANTYTISMTRRANNWHQIVLQTSAGGAVGTIFVNSSGTVDVLSASYSLNPGNYRIRFWAANLGDPMNIDNLLIQGNPAAGTGDLVIESGASLITDSNFDKTITINRTTSFADGRYSFVGSPVQQDASITGASLGSNVYWYDETVGYDADAGLGRWKDASAAELVPGKGYTQAGQSALSFVGIPNSGTINVLGLTKTATGTANASDQGWNLVGNPYPAAIDVAAFLAANSGIEGSISIWEDGGSNTGRRTNADYITANAIATVNGAAKDFEGYIGSMQGFFVKATVDNSEVIFTEEMRVSGNNADANFFRKAETKGAGIKLSLSNADQSFVNELYVGLKEDATVGVDRLYDATKLFGNTDLQFYSLINDMRFAIQGLPVVEGVSTELAFNLGEASELTLSVVELGELENGLSFFIHDAVTNKTYDLSEVQNFTFSSAAGSDQNRFTLTYGTANVLANELRTNQPLYRYNNGSLKVDFSQSLDVAEYVVYDLSGRIVIQNNALKNNVQNLEIPVFAKGINIVKISTSEGVFTRKFIF